MSTTAETPAAENTSSRRSRGSRSQRSSNSNAPDRSPPTYGYHNTFHTHVTPALTSQPPSYLCANSKSTLKWLSEKSRAEKEPIALPPYTCTVEMGGVMGVKQELSSPFMVSSSREWNDVYVVLRGTQLNLYRVKTPHMLSKSRTLGPGRLLKTFSLQHAEVGIASDFKKTSLVPRSPFAHLVPASTRQKLFETDPHLFEPVREHVIRLRLETEQFLLCAASQEEMLHWIEMLCAAIDISHPLEDRSEPRYRSLPRRSRRQRILEGRGAENLENLSNMEAGRRLIAEQERIIRQLYPHLAEGSNSEQAAEANDQAIVTTTTHADPETDDLDPEDVRFPSARRMASRDGESDERPSSSATIESSADPKSRPPHRHSASQALRYRRRCAPVLLSNSPRVSDVVFSGGKRMRIDVKEHILVDYTSHPPRYDAHNFPKQKKQLPSISESVAPKPVPAPISILRPGSPIRAATDDSITSFGYELASESSGRAGESDGLRSVASSEPPSPTAATQAKADTTRKLATLRKARNSEERTGDGGLNTVALGVSLMV